ncbi:phytanoyl-CoA dioxygenase family protein [Marinicrinis sediminis]|uniref:Phytanoyl-CoA dioxygenase family protein n=1 Tax=Marinicrinis sediminis TaxID=1652465 RepID=A0ABW5REE1_9BACL
MRRLHAEERAHLDEKGYVVIKGLYSEDEVRDIRHEFEKEWMDLIRDQTFTQEKARPLTSLFYPVRDRHLVNERLKKLMLDPRNFSLIEDILGEEPLAVGTGCFYKAPGAEVLPFHQDNYDIGVTPGTTWAVWISLDEATKENGALRFVPGTQQMELQPPRLPAHISTYGQAVRVPKGYVIDDVPTSPGDAVLFNGQILHGSNANQTSYQFRRAFVTHFTSIEVKKVFVHYNSLFNRHGEIVKRKLNKAHKLQFEKPFLRQQDRSTSSP